MFGNHTTFVYFWLFFLSFGFQIMDAGDSKAFPELRPTDNPLIHRDDPTPSFLDQNSLDDDEPILRWCVPTGNGNENISPENNEVDNSSDTSGENSPTSPDDCIPASDLNKYFDK